MAIKPLTLLAVLATAAISASSLPQPPQRFASAGSEAGWQAIPSVTEGVRSTSLRIEQYSTGSCATVSLEGLAEPVVDSCHGWFISDCDGVLLARSRGVRLDEAAVIRSAAGNKTPSVVRLKNLLEETLDRKMGGRHEYLELRFLEPQCNSDGATMAFHGSAIRIGATGSADPLRGTVRIGSDGIESLIFDLITGASNGKAKQ